KMRLREVGEVIRRLGRPGLAPDPQEIVEHRDLAAALAKLPPKQAAAIVLRHYHGYTNRAIAQALGIPERTVAPRLAVAKERAGRNLFINRARRLRRGLHSPTRSCGSSRRSYRGALEMAQSRQPQP